MAVELILRKTAMMLEVLRGVSNQTTAESELNMIELELSR